MEPTPQAMAGFLGCAFFLIAMAEKFLRLMDRNKEVPAPSQTYATKTEVAQISREIKNVETKLDRTVESIRTEMKADSTIQLAAGEERAGKLHERVDLILAAVSELKGDTRALQNDMTILKSRTK